MQSSSFSFSVPLENNPNSSHSWNSPSGSNVGVFNATPGPTTQTTQSHPPPTPNFLTLHPPPSTQTVNPALLARDFRLSRRSHEEREIQTRVAANFQRKLASDHASVLRPDIDSPFADYEDAVKRLLPYHVFQIPWDDVQSVIDACTPIGSSSQVELTETKFALECHRRRKRLKSRFVETLTRSGQRMAPDDQAYYLSQVVLEEEKQAHATLSNELKSARSELDRIEREKRLSQRLTQQTPSAAQPYQTTPQYRAYGYPYGQLYTQPAINPLPGAPLQLYPTPAPPPPQPTATASTTDIQLPISALPSLHALGIIPVPLGSVHAEGAQPPAALIKATNSTTLTIQINISLLHANQTTGLAILLRNLQQAQQTAVAGRPSVPSTPAGTSESTKS